jgi:hypothetical protein
MSPFDNQPATVRIPPTVAAPNLVAAAAALSVPTVGNAEDARNAEGTKLPVVGPRPSIAVVLISVAGLAVATFITLLLTNHFPYSPKVTAPVGGLTIFAVYFVAAQAIERLLEPVASLLGQGAKDNLVSATVDAQSKVNTAHVLSAAPGTTADAVKLANQAAQNALNTAANAKGKADQVQANRTVFFWALASAVGVVASAVLKLYLLTTVGVASPGRVLDVIATGLIIGSGTKPLHDLVTLISSKKSTSGH